MNNFVKELCFIKKAQREFKQLFGRELLVDMIAMKGINNEEDICMDPMEEMKAYLHNCAKKYNADMEMFRNNRCAKGSAEGEAVREFCAKVVEKGWNQTCAARMINRDRSALKYFAGYDKIRERRRKIRSNKAENALQ